MFFDRFHGYYRHHPHGAPILTLLIVVVVIAIVFALFRSNKT
jgi:uncharacterized membrane-anchored protein